MPGKAGVTELHSHDIDTVRDDGAKSYDRRVSIVTDPEGNTGDESKRRKREHKWASRRWDPRPQQARTRLHVTHLGK
jgi:hypothetical protein